MEFFNFTIGGRGLTKNDSIYVGHGISAAQSDSYAGFARGTEASLRSVSNVS